MPKASSRGRASTFGFVKLLLIILVIGAAVLGSVYFLSGNKWPWSKSVLARTDDEDHKGKIPVPLSVQPIAAFDLVEMENLVDPTTHAPRLHWIEPEKAKEKGFFTSYNDIVGRVMKFDKAPGKAFTEADFYAKGSKPTPALAIEPGMRGIWIAADKIEGLTGLKRFDEFDLMAVKIAGSDHRDQTERRYSDPGIEKSQASSGVWNTPSRVLVQKGKVIVPVAQGARGKGSDQMYIQVHTDEVNSLNEAIASGARISCLTRSATVGAEVEPLPTRDVPAPVEEIEVLSGTKSRIYVVPSGKNDTLEAEKQPAPVQEPDKSSTADPKNQPNKSAAQQEQ